MHGRFAFNTGKKASRRGGLILSLFGLPFFAFGCFATGKAVGLVAFWQSAKDWPQTQARILSVDLKTHTGDDSTTYEVVCTYTYEMGGRDYTGTRVGLSDGADNIGSWQKDTFERLKIAHQNQAAVACCVDPANPANALLSRELRPAMLVFWSMFSLIFGGAGAGMIAGGLYMRRNAKRRAALAAAHPDEPWMQNEHWARGRIPAGAGVKAIILWCLALFWNGISGPVFYFVVIGAVKEGHYWALVFALFPLIGLLLLYAAIRETIQHFKFGRSHLDLHTIPGRVGGGLRGELVLYGPLSAMATVRLTLKCERSTTTGSGKSRSTRTETVWEMAAERQAMPGLGGNPAFDMGGHPQGRTSVPVDFKIPPDAAPTSDAEANPKFTWKLCAKADVPGVDLDLEFEMPVYGEPGAPRRAETNPRTGTRAHIAAGASGK